MPSPASRSAVKGAQVSKSNIGRDNITVGVASEAQMKANAPVGPKILDNFVKNPTWADDGAYPGAQNGHGQNKSALNGRGSTYNNTILPAHWNHFSGLYTSTNTNHFDTLLNNYFLRFRKRDGEYKDIAAEISPSEAKGVNGNNQYEIGPNQNRILGLYGNSGHLNSRNNDADRTFGDIPVLHRTAGRVFDGVPDNSVTLADGAGWTKHSYYQMIEVPANAQKIKFGAYVRIPPNDQLNTNNFAAIELLSNSAMTGDVTNINHGRDLKVDMIYIHNDGETLPDVQSSAMGSDNNTRYNFAGIATSQTGDYPSWPNDFLWPDVNGVLVGNDIPNPPSGSSIRDAADFGEFKLVERLYGNGLSGIEGGSLRAFPGGSAPHGTHLKLELCFYEWSANIANEVGSTGSGSVQFYCPFVQFYSGSYGSDLDANFADELRISP